MNRLYYYMVTSSALAVLIATTWVIITRNQYGYNLRVLQIGDSLLFPLVAWILGLMFLSALYYFLHNRTGYPLFLTIGFYWIAVIIVETVAYHALGVMNLGTQSYAGLPYCDCLHAPHWMQSGYFLNGIVYLLLLKFGDLFIHWFPSRVSTS